MAHLREIESRLTDRKSVVLPLDDRSKKMVGGAGLTSILSVYAECDFPQVVFIIALQTKQSIRTSNLTLPKRAVYH